MKTKAIMIAIILVSVLAIHFTIRPIMACTPDAVIIDTNLHDSVQLPCEECCDECCEPCDDCMKLVETVGIKHVIFKKAYPTKMSALRKYFKVKSISISDLAKEYSDFCKGRITFSTSV